MKISFRRVLLRLKWYVFKLSGRRIVIDTGLGFRLLLEPSDGSVGQLFFGSYEPEEVATITQLLEPGMVALDIGANLGFFTHLMSRRLGAGGQVHAFESNPTMVERLSQNISLNHDSTRSPIKIHQVALSDRDGEAEFYCPVKGYEGAGGLRDTHRATIDEVIKVPVRALDGVLQELEIERVNFIKM